MIKINYQEMADRAWNNIAKDAGFKDFADMQHALSFQSRQDFFAREALRDKYYPTNYECLRKMV